MHGWASIGIVVVAATAAWAQSPTLPQPRPTFPARNFCTAPRPQICMQVYIPVCGVTKSGHMQTYPNACQACAHPEVERTIPGACAGPG